MPPPDPSPFTKIRRKLGRAKRALLGIREPSPQAYAGPIYEWSADGLELRTHTPELPMHLMHVMYNEAYFTHLDHLGRGRGFHQGPEGHIVNIIENERIIYARDDDSGEYCALSFAPVFRQFDRFLYTAGINYQIIEQDLWGVRFTWKMWVPAGRDPVEIWDVRVENLGDRPRRINLVSHLVMKLDGTDLDHGELYRSGRYLPEHRAIYIQQNAERHQFINFPFHNAFVACSPDPAGWNANPGTFTGARRSLANPEAIEKGALAGSDVALYPPAISLHAKFDLAADSAEQIRWLIGACDAPERIPEFRTHYLDLSNDAGFSDLQAANRKLFGHYQFALPDVQLNHMLNSWVQKQIHMGATWCRWGWKGYRDALQQSVAVAGIESSAARANLIGSCAHQHANGFGVRGWRPLDDRRYSDGHAWLILSTIEYVRETGDFDLLEEKVRFLEANSESAKVYDHLRRALERYWNDRGQHGLCLIYEGDWNDSLTGAGRGGRGESVMLSMMFCRCALEMSELAKWIGRGIEAARYREWAAQMQSILRDYAWDGEWWLCAYDDDGIPIGSHKNDEGKFFLMPQVWAQLAGVTDPERWTSSWAAVEKYLNPGYGLMLSWPVYTRPRPNIGRLSYILPGHNENASVYTHGSAFAFMALLERGQADRALQCLLDILPGNSARPVPPQPNVLFNGFYGPDSPVKAGLADYAWFTGSAAWLFWGITELMLGMRRGFDGIRVQPCMPALWRDARFTRIYRGTTYHLQLQNPAGMECPKLTQLEVDGISVKPDEPLPLDQNTHQIVVSLGC